MLKNTNGAAQLLTEHGMAALKSGDKERARDLLFQAVRIDDKNEQAWLWLSGAVESDAEKWRCLEKVLTINPGNMAAKKGIEKLSVANMLPKTSIYERQAEEQTAALTPLTTRLSKTPTNNSHVSHPRRSLVLSASPKSTSSSVRMPSASSSTESPPGHNEKLDPGEELIEKFHMHPVFRRPGSNHLLITDKRVILRGGLLGKVEHSVLLNKIQNVKVSLTVKGRMLGYGTIEIEANTRIVVENLANPEAVKSTILSLVNQ